MTLKTLAVATIMVIGMLTGAQAQVIPVTNGSFEDPVTSSFIAATSDAGPGTPIPGWTFVDNTYSGICVTTNPFPTGAGGVGATGLQAAFLNIQSPVPATITSDPITTILANTDYQASVAVGNPTATGGTGYNDPGAVTLNLLADNTVIATNILDTSTIPNGDFENFTITLSAPVAAAFVGKSLEFQIVAFDPGSNLLSAANTFEPIFDNVTLTAESVPEPMTWACVAMGLLLLVAVQRRRLLA